MDYSILKGFKFCYNDAPDFYDVKPLKQTPEGQKLLAEILAEGNPDTEKLFLNLWQSGVDTFDQEQHAKVYKKIQENPETDYTKLKGFELERSGKPFFYNIDALEQDPKNLPMMAKACSDGSHELANLLLNFWQSKVDTTGCCSLIDTAHKHERPIGHAYVNLEGNLDIIYHMFTLLVNENKQSLDIGASFRKARNRGKESSVIVPTMQIRHQPNTELMTADESNAYFKWLNKVLETAKQKAQTEKCPITIPADSDNEIFENLRTANQPKITPTDIGDDRL